MYVGDMEVGYVTCCIMHWQYNCVATVFVVELYFRFTSTTIMYINMSELQCVYVCMDVMSDLKFLYVFMHACIYVYFWSNSIFMLCMYCMYVCMYVCILYLIYRICTLVINVLINLVNTRYIIIILHTVYVCT